MKILNSCLFAWYKSLRTPFFHTRVTRLKSARLRMLLLIDVLLFPNASLISSNVNGSPSKYKKANNRASTGDKSNISIVFENSSMILFVISLLSSDIKSLLKALLYKGYNKSHFFENRKYIIKLKESREN